MTTPAKLGAGGRQLWTDIAEAYELDAVQLVQLLEACRTKDRLDRLDAILRGQDRAWMTLEVGDAELTIKMDSALGAANSTANLLKQLLAALRLPEESTGKRPQYRGARGAQKPSVPGGSAASAKERLRVVG